MQPLIETKWNITAREYTQLQNARITEAAFRNGRYEG